MHKDLRKREIENMKRVSLVLKHPIFVERLEKLAELEKDRIFCRHGMDHLLAVARLAYIFNLERNLGIPKDLIYATALLHDIGRSVQYIDGTPHSIGGAPLAEQVLKDCGFDEAEIEMAIGAIKEHSDETPSDRSSDLSTLIYDADKQSRDCFSCAAESICKWDPEMKNMTVIW